MGAGQSYDAASDSEEEELFSDEEEEEEEEVEEEGEGEEEEGDEADRQDEAGEALEGGQGEEEEDARDSLGTRGRRKTVKGVGGKTRTFGSNDDGAKSEDESDVESEDLSEEDPEGVLEQEPELSPFRKHLSPLDPQLPGSFNFEDPLTLPEGPRFPSLYEPSSVRPFGQLDSSEGQESPTFKDYDPNPTADGVLESLTRQQKAEYESQVGDDFKSMHSIHAAPHSNPLFHDNVHKFQNQITKEEIEWVTEVYLIRHGEATHNTLNIVGGRSPSSQLTALGLSQAISLGKYLKHFTDIRFDAVYSSTIDRAKATAIAVCKELSIPESSIRYSEDLQELSHGEWEGRPRSEIYTQQLTQKLNNNQPDFRAPGGESQRQVEFRMLEFINSNLLHWNSLQTSRKALPQMENGQKKWVPSKYAKFPSNRDFSESSLKSMSEMDSDAENEYSKSSAWEIYNVSDKSGELLKLPPNEEAMENLKSPLDEVKPSNPPSSKTRIAIFSHGLAIKCLLKGILSSSPSMTHKISIDNTSISVIKHSSLTGWHLLKINDTSHHLLLNKKMTL